MPVATTNDGVEIGWESVGEGLPLVLIHGVTQTRRFWDPIATALGKQFRVLRLDLRGHGESGRATDYSYRAMTQDVAAVVDAAGVSEPVVVGHSLGGLVATTYASEHESEPWSTSTWASTPVRSQRAVRMLEPSLRGPDYRDTLRSMLAALAGDAVPDAHEADDRGSRRGSPSGRRARCVRLPAFEPTTTRCWRLPRISWRTSMRRTF